MPTFEMEVGGKRYQVEAPTAEAALNALQGNKPPNMQGQFADAFDGAQADEALQKRASEEVPSTFESALHGLGQGASLGFLDEAVGLVSPSTAENMRKRLGRAREYHPIATGIGEVGGALATAPIVPQATIAKGAGLVARGINSGVTGAGLGAAYGAGSSEGDLGDRAKGAAGGAAFGGVAGAIAAPVVSIAKGIGHVIGTPFRAARGALNPDKEAARRVVSAIERDVGSPQTGVQMLDDAQRAGQPAIAADIGETSRAVGRSAANTSPEARVALNAATDARFESQTDRVINLVRRNAPTNAPATLDSLQSAAKAANRPAYEAAYRAGEAGIWTPEIQAITASPSVQAAIRDATKTGANRAVVDGFKPPVSPFSVAQDGTIALKPGTRPTLQFWDNVKQNLDSAIGTARRGGDDPLVRDLTRLKTALVTELDRAVPLYAKARQGAAQFFGAENALDAGAAFVTSRADNEAARRVIAKMNPAERELFKEGFATEMVNRLREASDRRSIINSMFIASPAARERIHMALGSKTAMAMEAQLRLENIFDLTRRSLQGNSTTARQLTELGLAGGAGLMVGGGNVMDPKALATAAFIYGLRRGSAKIDQNVARRVGDMLASSDPQVIQKAVDMIGKSNAMMKALREAETYLTRAVLPGMPKTGPLEITVTKGTYQGDDAGVNDKADAKGKPLQ